MNPYLSHDLTIAISIISCYNSQSSSFLTNPQLTQENTMKVRNGFLAALAMAMVLWVISHDSQDHQVPPMLTFDEYCKQHKLECSVSVEYGDGYTTHNVEIFYPILQWEGGTSEFRFGLAKHYTSDNGYGHKSSHVTYALPSISWSQDIGRSVNIDRTQPSSE